MSPRQYRTLTKRIVDRLAVDDKDTVFWDRELPGFGLRVYPLGAKVYVVQTRCAGRSKRVTVGRHGDLAPDQARKETARIIARIKAGEAPVPDAPKADPAMAELVERYQREHVAMRCRAATIAHYGIMLAKHILVLSSSSSPVSRLPVGLPGSEFRRGVVSWCSWHRLRRPAYSRCHATGPVPAGHSPSPPEAHTPPVSFRVHEDSKSLASVFLAPLTSRSCFVPQAARR